MYLLNTAVLAFGLLCAHVSPLNHHHRFNGCFCALLYTSQVLPGSLCSRIPLLHLSLSKTSCLQSHLLHILLNTKSHQGFFGLPQPLLSSTAILMHFLTQSSSPFLFTCPNHLNLILLAMISISSVPYLFSRHVSLFHIL